MNTSQEIYPQFTKSLLHPRYWLTWIGISIWYLLVLLPYPVIYQLGKSLGLLIAHVLPKRRDTAKQNIKLCFPDMPQNEQNKLLRDNFISTGIAVFETGMAWFWSDKRIKKHAQITGDKYIKQVQQTRQGILLLGIHFLTLELGGRILGINHPGVGVYRPNNNKVFDYIQLKGRLKSNKYMISRYNTKGMVRALKNGEILWYAPDHDYGPKNSVFAPFFAVDKAATTVGTSILVKLAQPAIIPFTPKRENKGQYVVSVSPPLNNYPQDNNISAAIFMNKTIEKEILKAPQQYMWLHRRFKTRPVGAIKLYTNQVQNN